jgi:hypothetical protein
MGLNASELDAYPADRRRRRGRLGGRPNPIDPRDVSRSPRPSAVAADPRDAWSGFAGPQAVDAASSFRPSWVYEREAWIGPEPVGEAIAERLSVDQGQMMSGRSGVGVPYGIQGSLVDTETAYMVGQQNFAGPVQMGATTRIIDDPEPAFPSTRIPPALDDLFNPWSSVS